MTDVLKRPLVITLASSTLFQALSIVTGVVLARTLGPSGRGELGTVVLWPTVLAFLALLGLPDAISVLTAGRTLTSGDALRSALPVVGLLAGPGMIAAAAIEYVLITGIDATSRSAAVMYLAFIPINMITMTFAGVLSGNRQFGALNAARLSVMIVAAAALPVLALAGHLTVLTAVLTYLAANLVALGLAVGFVLRRPAARVGVASRWTARRLLDFGLRSQAGGVAGLLSERLDQMAISVLLLPMQFGLYLAAVTLSSGASLIASSMTTVLLPTIAAMSPELRLDAVRRNLRITAALAIGYALVLIILAPVILNVFFGPEFEAAGLAARVLLLGTIPLTVSRSLAAVSRASGRPGGASRAEWLGLACAAPAYALLIPPFGVVGAAWAFVIAGTASLAFQASTTRSSLGAPSVWTLVQSSARDRR